MPEKEEKVKLLDGQRVLYVKCPASFDITELELNGNFVILKGFTSAFGKITESTRIFKRMK